MKDVVFLDDDPKRTQAFVAKIPHATCVETAQEVIDILGSQNKTHSLFLDHDLGGEIYVDSDRPDTGMEVVRWIETNKPTIDLIFVHTMNPGAGTEMTNRLEALGYHVRRIPFNLLINNIGYSK